MKAVINSTGVGKRGYPTKSSVPSTQASTQRRARERSVAIQTLLLVRKSKSSSVKDRKSGSAGMPRPISYAVFCLKKKKKKKKEPKIISISKRDELRVTREQLYYIEHV